MSEQEVIREATHAGTWYTSDGPKLYAELSNWLNAVTPENIQPEVYGEGEFIPPIKGSKAIIAPHAGYSYSGPAAAWAYKSIDTAGIKRVFILGPSHHVYLEGCALSKCTSYETPIGDLPLDLETIAELKATGEFSDMDVDTDQEEHSIEMHLPYIRKIFEGLDIKVVPVLVGAINKATERHFGSIIGPHMQREDTFTVISSDFCHWGTRFSYTQYYPTTLPLSHDTPPTKLSTSVRPSPDRPIWESIRDLDHEGMDVVRLPPTSPDQNIFSTHDLFTNYLGRTRNTICGRHPIGVLLGALSTIEETGTKEPIKLKWVRYEQSSKCKSIRDSSVSYASAYVIF